VFDLVGVSAATDLGFELAEGVIDLVAPFGELADDAAGDAVDLPSAVAASGPTSVSSWWPRGEPS
jgi:hypothetical protein